MKLGQMPQFRRRAEFATLKLFLVFQIITINRPDLQHWHAACSFGGGCKRRANVIDAEFFDSDKKMQSDQ
jgi:hypothetical protein